MSTKHDLFDLAAMPFAWFFHRANRVNVRLAAKADPIYEAVTIFGKLKLHCPTALSLWRAKTLTTKEPDTIKWINSFGPDTVLYDVGANVGLYSLYAALTGAQVVSFEPEAQNYALLNRNIHANALQNKITALNIALCDANRISHLHLSRFEVAGAMHNFDEPVDYNKQPFVPEFKQGVMGARLDDLIKKFDLPRPTHIKIDVDGCERAVIDGAIESLTDLRLKSVLIEINDALSADLELLKILENIGYRMVSRLRSPLFFESSSYASVYNYIYERP